MPPTPPPSATAEQPVQDAEVVVQMIPLELIDRSRNHRLPRPGDQQRTEALAETLKEFGQIQAVRVHETSEEYQPDVKSPYILACGHRRCSALLLIGESEVKAEVHAPASDETIEAIRDLENLQRQDLTPIEEANAVGNLLRLTQREDFLRRHPILEDPKEYVARELGKSVEWVRIRAKIDRLHSLVQEIAVRTRIPAGALYELAKVGDEERQLRLAIECVGGDAWMVDEARSLKTNQLVATRRDSQEHLDQWLDDAEQYCGRRLTPRTLRRRVEEAMRSLRTVPWVHDEAVEVRKDVASRLRPLAVDDHHLRPCAGCPHNTATDPDLFGEDEDAKNPRGTCSHPPCFDAKTKAVETAKTKLATVAGRRKTEPTPREVEAKAPDWLKPSSAVSAAKSGWREAHPEPEQAPSKPPATPEEQTPAVGDDGPTPERVTLATWQAALQDWCVDAAARIAQSTRSLDSDQRGRLTAWLLLTMLDPNQRRNLLLFDVWKCDGTLADVDELATEDFELVEAAVFCDHNRLELELAQTASFDPMELPIGAQELLLHPVLLEELAKAWSIKLDPRPRPPGQATPADEDDKAAAVADRRRQVESAEWRQQPLMDVLKHAGVSFHGLGELGQHGASTLGELVELLDDDGRVKKAVPGIGPKKWAKFRFAAAKWIHDRVDVGEDLPPWLFSERVDGKTLQEVRGK